MSTKRQLNILYTNIGRGHPYYLDGIVEAIKTKYPDEIKLNIVDLYFLSRRLSLKLWHLVRWLYRTGSQGGTIGWLYGGIRKGRSSGHYGFLEKCLARDIRKYLLKENFPTLVAHPILVPMISDIVDTYYQHGEIAVPDEAVVKGARAVFVPLDTTKIKFQKAGLLDNRIITTGLCIEKQLIEKARDCFTRRLLRTKNNEPLCGAFFSSGAEPAGHIYKITLMVNSLRKSGGWACVFCKKGGSLESAITSRMKLRILDNINDVEELERTMRTDNILGFSYKNRQEENDFLVHLFGHFDYFVAPSHERTNWAIGLGLPMFILSPAIGTFSPLNRRFLLEKKVAVDMDTNQKAIDFADMLSDLVKNGTLAHMAQNGFDKYNINGFESIADYLRGELI
jgi:hypothetical protein